MAEIASAETTAAAYWDAVAGRYLELFRDEMEQKPFDTGILSEFARQLPAGAEVCDAGCGPCGHVTRLLANEGVQPVGIDLSPKCVELARGEQPDLRFEVADMASMPFADASFDGLVSYYALHYLPKNRLRAVFREFARVLRQDGTLLIAVKEGRSEGWIDDPMGSATKVYWSDFEAEELRKVLEAGEFTVTRCEVRDPLAQEAAVRRIYLWARRNRSPKDRA